MKNGGENLFGNFVKKLRQERGLTLRKLGKAIDVDPAYISRIERGLAPPSMSVLRALADFFNSPELFDLAGRKIPPDFWEERVKNRGELTGHVLINDLKNRRDDKAKDDTDLTTLPEPIRRELILRKTEWEKGLVGALSEGGIKAEMSSYLEGYMDGLAKAADLLNELKKRDIRSFFAGFFPLKEARILADFYERLKNVGEIAFSRKAIASLMMFLDVYFFNLTGKPPEIKKPKEEEKG